MLQRKLRILGKHSRSFSAVPSTARTVIVGGGAVGSSVAYHLAKLGRKEIVILEQGAIGCGTTWHAAGLVGQLRNTPSEIYLSCYGSQLYAELEKETGQATGFKKCGSLTLAQTDDRIIALKRNAARAKAFNIEAHMISGDEANELLGGIIETRDIKGALWLPGDGTISPTDLTASYIAGAKQNGVKLVENVKVTNFTVDPKTNQVTVVHTTKGDIRCDEVVNCAGQWSRNVGKMAGVDVPLHSAEHFYIITEPFKPVLSTNMPLFRDPDFYTYFREWSGGLCAGGFEPKCKPCFPVVNDRNQIPDKFEFQLFEEDWNHFQVLMDGAIKRIPSLETMGVCQMVNGPESFTADNQYILGEAPERRKFFVAAGFNSSGIASSGGAGKALAEWIVGGESPLDLWTVDIRRFSRLQNNGKYLHDRTLETLGLHYQINYPKRELESSRPLRKSVIYEQLKSNAAVFGNKFGWERPNFFSPTLYNVPQLDWLTFQRPKWFDDVRREHQACRENVAIFDQSSFAKYLLQGRDATSFIERLCSNAMDVEIGKIVYTGMLNEKGGMESDITVTRVDSDQFLIITSTAQAVKDLNWIQRQMKPSEMVSITDITSSYSVFSVMGPNSRALLSQITNEDFSNDTFPFGTSKMISIGYASVRANRITYVGELGWELYVPVELSAYVYQHLNEAGQGFGLQDAGYYAIDCLRMEKGYRAWGADLSSDWTPFECGLGFAVKLNKANPFIGQEALKKLKPQPLQKQLWCFTIDDSAVFPWGSEAILYKGETVGFVTSAAYGHTVNKGVVFAMIKGEDLLKSISQQMKAGQAVDGFQIDVNGKLYPVTISAKPVYDPQSVRIKM